MSVNVAEMNSMIHATRTLERLQVVPASTKPRISILGLGYVGAVSAACFAKLGHVVVGVDPDRRKIRCLNEGRSPIVEAELPELLSSGVSAGRISATNDAMIAVLDTDVTMVSVGTPSGYDGGCDLTYLKQATRDIGRALQAKSSYHLVVFRSTVPPGTTRKTLIPILESESGKQCGKDFGVCFNPEFLRESTAIRDFHAPPKTVIGANDKRSARYGARLYRDVDDNVLITSLDAAECVKYVDNTWHAVKVSFANEIGRLCKSINVDSHQVMDIFVQDTKLNLSPYYLKPGFAFGGSCLPKDVRGMTHLAHSRGLYLPLLESIMSSNKRHIAHAMALIESMLGRRVGLLGVTFKSGTDDLRESPMLKLIDLLEARSYEVNIYDPCITPGHTAEPAARQACSNRCATRDVTDLACESAESLVERSDIVVVAHDDPQYLEAVAKHGHGKPVLDLVRVRRNGSLHADVTGICW